MSSPFNDDLSDSEEEYTHSEKLLLEKARSSLRKRTPPGEEEVFGFGSKDDDDDDDEEDEDNEEEGEGNIFHGSEDEDEDDDDDIDMGSDLEGEGEPLLDERAWGTKRKSFYNTDYVDQDYGGIYQGKDAEAAELEEQEARTIQKRLLEQLNDADFSFGDIIPAVESLEATSGEQIKSDLTKLTKRQKLDLLKKESPEFFVLVEDFKEKLTEVKDRLLPTLKLIEEKKLPACSAADFVETKFSLIMNYCTNISFYLLLKSKRVSVKDHPVLQSLFYYRKLLEQLEPIDKDVINPQLDVLLDMLKAGKELELGSSKLNAIREKEHSKKVDSITKEDTLEKESEEKDKEDYEDDDDDDHKDTDNRIDEDGEETEGNQKRAITYTMAKNKGLIPKRSKEQRNPRVKHRNKYRKAKIRRRGQVRLARTAIPVYGGEPTGIKAGVTKSIKFK